MAVSKAQGEKDQLATPTSPSKTKISRDTCRLQKLQQKPNRCPPRIIHGGHATPKFITRWPPVMRAAIFNNARLFFAEENSGFLTWKCFQTATIFTTAADLFKMAC